MSKNMIRIVTTILIFLAHIAAYFQFHCQIEVVSFPQDWIRNFGILLTISLMITFIIPICRKKGILWFLFIFKATILWVIGLPLGNYLGVEITLLSSLVIEASIYISELWHGVIFAFLVSVLIIVSQRTITAWNILMPVPSTHDLISMIVYVGMVFVLGVFLRIQNNSQISYAELNQKLHEASLNLAQANLQLQEYAVMAEQQAELSERKRLAREIHDTLAYTLTNLIMMLEAALDLTKGDRKTLIEHLVLARDQAKAGLSEVRRALQALRPTEIAEMTGLKAIFHLVKTFTKATNIDVTLNMGDAPLTFGPEADLTAYRLVQEGITNAMRHGLATKIIISMACKGKGVIISIKDNGIGTSQLQTGFGLMGMRERIEKLGGELEIFSKPGEGFFLSAWLPFAEGYG
jgi:signal transduction histidine kinase